MMDRLISMYFKLATRLAFFILSLLVSPLSFAAAPSVPLQKAPIDPYDKVSLQRGATLYINYCQACHSLQYVRYNAMAEHIGLVDVAGELDEELVKANFIFSDARISDTMQSSISVGQGEQWFGIPIPDLTLITRSKGTNWLYTYLLSFYEDDTKQYGVNNLVFKDVGMPNVLGVLQGTQKPVYRSERIEVDGEEQEIQTIEGLELTKPGLMTENEFQQAVTDLTNFLAYTGEPFKQKRQNLGLWVLGFLFLLAVFTYMLKEEYWKDIKK